MLKEIQEVYKRSCSFRKSLSVVVASSALYTSRKGGAYEMEIGQHSGAGLNRRVRMS